MTSRRLFVILFATFALFALCLLSPSSQMAGIAQAGYDARELGHHAAGHCTAKTEHEAIVVALGATVAVHGRSATCQSVDGHPVLIFLANE